ncbi:hypothetical protein [Bradyrhizobium sp. USDA 3650]
MRQATNLRAEPANHELIAIMLDFVDPRWAAGGRATFDGWHGSMKPDGRRTAPVPV